MCSRRSGMGFLVQTLGIILLASCVLAQNVPHHPEKHRKDASPEGATGVEQTAADHVNGGVNPANTDNNAVQNAPPVANPPDMANLNQFKAYCKSVCKTSPCPVECTQAFLDPWALKKRSVREHNGLSFDDYLFMRWLGRDMIRTGMKR